MAGGHVTAGVSCSEIAPCGTLCVAGNVSGWQKQEDTEELLDVTSRAASGFWDKRDLIDVWVALELDLSRSSDI